MKNGIRRWNTKITKFSVFMKPFFYEIGMKLSKLVNKPVNVGFQWTDVQKILLENMIVIYIKQR